MPPIKGKLLNYPEKDMTNAVEDVVRCIQCSPAKKHNLPILGRYLGTVFQTKAKES